MGHMAAWTSFTLYRQLLHDFIHLNVFFLSKVRIRHVRVVKLLVQTILVSWNLIFVFFTKQTAIKAQLVDYQKLRRR